MIRTAISFLALFGSLLFVSKALTQTRPQEKLPAARPQVTPVEGWRSRAAPAPAAPVTALPGRASVAPPPFSQPPTAGLPTASLPTAGLREAAATGTHSGFRRLLSAAVRTGSTLEQLLRNPITGQIENLWQNVTSFDSRPEAGTDWKPEAGTDWKAGSSITAQTPASASSRRERNESASLPLQSPAPRRFTVEDGVRADEKNSSSSPAVSDIEPRRIEPRLIEPRHVESTTTVAEDEPLPLQQAEPEAETPAAPPRELSPELLALRQKLRDVLAYHIERPESAENRSPWGIMHALIAYGVDTEIYAGGRRVNAIGWLCYNGPCRAQQLFYAENGRLQARQGPGVQGHEGQFLAMLAQSKVKADFPIRADGKKYTVLDLIEYEKETCRPDTELTFKLIGLVHYLETDASWKNRWGESWDMPRLIKEELAQPVVGAACGGTHRMMGFSYAVKKREKKGEPLDGQWLRAKKYVDAYHEYTFKLQNEDGSFSTDWFSGPGAWGTIDRRIETTGHILEWMVYSLPEEQLADPRLVKAVNYLATLMRENLTHDWSIGPKGHALHALAIYDERMFQGNPGNRRTELAEHRKQTAAR